MRSERRQTIFELSYIFSHLPNAMASKSKAPTASTSASPVTAQVIPPTAGNTAEFSGSQFAALLSAIKQSETKLDQKFADFRSDMVERRQQRRRTAYGGTSRTLLRRRRTRSKRPSMRRCTMSSRRPAMLWRPPQIHRRYSGQRRRSNKVLQFTAW